MKKLAMLALMTGIMLFAAGETFAQCGPGFYGGGYGGYRSGLSVAYAQPGFGVAYGYGRPVYAAPVFRPHYGPRPVVYRGGFHGVPHRAYRPVGPVHHGRGYGGVYFRF